MLPWTVNLWVGYIVPRASLQSLTMTVGKSALAVNVQTSPLAWPVVWPNVTNKPLPIL